MPHLHFAFVPVTEDKRRGGYKVSAKEVISRKELQTFHQDLDKRMTEVFGRDIGVLNEATKGGNKEVVELKCLNYNMMIEKLRHDVSVERTELEKIKDYVQKGRTYKTGLEQKIQALDDKINKLYEEYECVFNATLYGDFINFPEIRPLWNEYCELQRINNVYDIEVYQENWDMDM